MCCEGPLRGMGFIFRLFPTLICSCCKCKLIVDRSRNLINIAPVANEWLFFGGSNLAAGFGRPLMTCDIPKISFYGQERSWP